MMDGCLERPKTSAPSRKTRVATYWFAPLIKLTTAITEVTPMTTPIKVRTLRNLCAHRLDVAIDTASVRCMVDARGIGVAAGLTSYYTHHQGHQLLSRTSHASRPTLRSLRCEGRVKYSLSEYVYT